MIFCIPIISVFFIHFEVKAQKYNQYSLSPVAIFDGIRYENIIFSDNKKIGWICGAMGVALKTTDGGLTWNNISPYKELKENEAVAFAKIIFKPDNKTGWLIGAKGTVYSTIDGGENWVLKKIKTRRNLIDVQYSKDYKTLRILNEYSEIFESQDNGQTWKEKIDLEFIISGIESTEKSFLTYGGSDVYTYEYKSNKLIDISKTTFNLIDFKEVKKIKYNHKLDSYIAIYDNGFIISYKENGSWESIGKIDSLKTAYDICFDQTGKKIFAIGDYSKLFKSIDGGKNWSLVLNLNHDGFDFYSIVCSKDSKDIWICGSNRTIIHSADFGLTWKYKTGNYFGNSYFPLLSNNFSINAGISETYYDKRKKLLYSVGDKGIISATDLIKYKSERLSRTDIEDDFYGLHFDSVNNNIFAVGENLKIVKYSFSLKKTIILYEEPKSKITLNSICFTKDGIIGIAVGKESSILITKDSGNNWTNVTDFYDDYISFSDIILKDNKFFIVGEKGTLLIYDIKKNKWTKQLIGDDTEHLISIDFSSRSNVGFITSSDSYCRKHLYKSYNTEKQWIAVDNIPNNNSRNLQHVQFNKISNEVYVTDSYGGIYKSGDYGLNWFKIFPWITYESLKFISFDNNNNPIFSGGDGALFVCKKSDNIPKIIEFNIHPSTLGNWMIPEVKLSDIEQNDKLVYSLTILNDLNSGSDNTFKNQVVSIENKDQLRKFPSEIFITGKFYTFKLTVFDGWNIITKEIKIKTGESKFERFAKFMNWSPLPSNDEVPVALSKNFSLLTVLYSFFVLLLFLCTPRYFILWHEAVANSKLPFPEKLSKFLVLFLIESDRSLNAFVKIHKERAVKLINSHEEVKSRFIWVKAPFNIDNNFDIIGFLPQENEKSYIPGLREIQQNIRDERIIIRIEGQGGFGKTSLSLQICRWAAETDKNKRLLQWTCLPIYIDKLGDKNLDEICLEKLDYLCDSRGISKTLSEALLRKKRVIVIVDGLSEMGKVDEKQYLPDVGAKHAHLIVYSSRKPIEISQSTVIYPMGLKIDFLDMLLDSFTNTYAEAYKFGEQREILRYRVKLILAELNGKDQSRPVALSLLREIVKQASKFIDDEKNLTEFLPKSVGELYDNYVYDLFKRLSNYESLIEDLRSASLISIGLADLLDSKFSLEKQIEVKPTWVLKSVYSKFITNENIEIFLSSGAMNHTGEVGLTYLKFKHDPVGEYLASVKILVMFKHGIISLEELIYINDSSSSISFNSLLISTANRMNLNISF